ncbi:FecR domain-containing protein [uncultured Algoriphagus sp.]|uniref:FecR family protein n=1 Tax=uncultured Algoriphagus sp. TaxID=417365 RepID=UPI0030EB4C57|tara:strand:- start:18649 stop:19704 length:1056 start_codon:yes stop_codon:yes gene_type:complete
MSEINDLLEDLEFIRWVKYPDNELTIFWKSWLDANPDRIEDVKLAREIILGFQFPAPIASSETKKEVLNRILRNKDKGYASDEKQLLIKPIQKNWQRRSWQFSRVAAILTGMFLLSVLLLNLKNENKTEEILNTVTWVSKTTNPGEKLNFRLPDQTIVWLNSGSSLEYPETFDSTVRLVKLKGEGFFEVSENAQQPFIVNSDSLFTTALGTSFNINVKNSGEIKVSLVTGKVSINYQSDTLEFLLTPGEELSYETKSNQGKVTEFNAENVLGWKTGKLIFKRAPLHEVMEGLEEWYGVEISITGYPSEEWRFNGKFENQTLENVLKSMSNIENFSYKIENKKVKIYFNNNN